MVRSFCRKIVELEEELRVVGNNLKSLEVSEEKVSTARNESRQISTKYRIYISISLSPSFKFFPRSNCDIHYIFYILIDMSHNFSCTRTSIWIFFFLPRKLILLQIKKDHFIIYYYQ